MAKRYEIWQMIGVTGGLLHEGYDASAYLSAKAFWLAEFNAGNEQGYLQFRVWFDTDSVLWDESMHREHVADNAIMLELALGSLEIGRATLCPVTLATIGLPSSEMVAIARELREERKDRALEALTMAHKVLCAFKARPADVTDLEYCPHGQAFDTVEQCDASHTCSDCAQSAAEDSEVPAEWFAGGFASNH